MVGSLQLVARGDLSLTSGLGGPCGGGTSPSGSLLSSAMGGSAPRRAVDLFAEDVGVTGVPAGFLDHVGQ